jgi:hypothetical protein
MNVAPRERGGKGSGDHYAVPSWVAGEADIYMMSIIIVDY